MNSDVIIPLYNNCQTNFPAKSKHVLIWVTFYVIIVVGAIKPYDVVCSLPCHTEYKEQNCN